MKRISRFKKGAASFYIVAISTLILVIIAASFAAVIISEVTRTSNDDLAQSAYDSALAGVEDAKLAYYNYRDCVESGAGKVTGLNNDGNISCEEIRYLVEDSDSCDMTAKILSRIGENDQREVLIEESSSASNDMQQAYTCVKLTNILPSYRATLSGNNPAKVVRAKFDGENIAKTIKSIKVSWQADSDEPTRRYANFGDDGIFPKDNTLVPPVISVGLVQTAGTFNLSDFDMTVNGQTDRGTLYLVPTGNGSLTDGDNYKVASNNHIGSDGFLKSNDKTVKNLPYAVYCDGDSYACSVTIELPEPVNGAGARSDETFMVVLSMPYADSSTSVDLAFCADAAGCYTTETVVDGGVKEETTQVPLKGVQIGIDSTGRANDLYRRVETILEPADTAYPYPLYAIQVLGNDSGSLIKKNLSPTCEQNFTNSPNCD